jgi:hypothetical protein
MKFIGLLSAILVTCQFNYSFGQSIHDPAKVEGTVELIPEGVETRSQQELAALWIDKMYFSWYPETANGMMKMGTSQVVKFIKKGDYVSEIWVGNEGVEDKYPLSGVSGSYFCDRYAFNHMHNLYLTEKAIVCYTINTSDYTVNSIDWCARSRKSYKATIKEIQAYLDYAKLKTQADRTARENARAEHRKKYTLEGKDVVSIEIIFPNGAPSVMTLDGVELGFEATLADGSKIKTANLGGQGYVEDYEFEFHNGTISGARKDYSPGMYGEYYVPETTIHGAYTDIMDRDIFKMTVRSQYGGSAVAELIVPLRYPYNFEHFSSGEDGYTYPGLGNAAGGAAGHGSPLTISVKTVKHTETNEDIYLVKIVDGFTGAAKYIKLSQGGSLEVNVNGGRGGDGQRGTSRGSDDSGKPGTGGNGGRGGNGGDIVLIKDPGAKDFSLVYNNKAGQGGGAGAGGNCFSCPYGSTGDRGKAGIAGDSGSFTESVKKVTF